MRLASLQFVRRQGQAQPFSSSLLHPTLSCAPLLHWSECYDKHTISNSNACACTQRQCGCTRAHLDLGAAPGPSAHVLGGRSPRACPPPGTHSSSTEFLSAPLPQQRSHSSSCGAELSESPPPPSLHAHTLGPGKGMSSRVGAQQWQTRARPWRPRGAMARGTAALPAFTDAGRAPT